MRIWIEDDYAALSKRAADIIKNQVDAMPNTVLGLATGSTPEGTYSELVRLYKTGAVDFSKVVSFNLDEYFPIKKTNEQSYYYFMRKHLFDNVNISEANTHIPNGEAEDRVAECDAYDKKIASYGGVDLQLLGIGGNGHIGFNEPSDVFVAGTHHIELDASTIEANARFFASTEDVPKHSLTMGIRTIMSAKRILLLASGSGKAEAIHKTIFGDITPKVPASVLQLHPDATIILDKEAARLIVGKLS
ncbi:MAG: glucosamine-6-phosphate deaminase [Defluviitaleaceae bacterium]|nr:glucosamine-6-phosphate deaminase [Defluviitaleaceae bacterium]